MRNRYAFIGILAIVLIIVSIVFLSRSSMNSSPINQPSSDFQVDSSWAVATSSQASWRYPADIRTSYIGTVDWPPQLQVVNEAFACTEAGSETSRAGITERMTVGGNEYCRTVVSGAAAGSRYEQYAFAFPDGSRTLIFTFTLRFPQCDNYDEPRRSACKEEQSSFDVDEFLNGIRRTLVVS